MGLTFSPICFILAITLSNLPDSLQDCARPTLNPDVIITPDDPSYQQYYFFIPSCPDGYTQAGPNDRIFCTPGSPDYWDPDPSTTCTASASCSYPSFNDTTVIITPNQPSYDPYTIVNFTCSSGDLQGPEDASCQNDGSWSYPSEPYCEERCNAPANSNGTGEYMFGSIVTFTCSQRFVLEGGSDSVVATCDIGKAWKPPVTCLSFGCIEPEVPANVTYLPVQETYDVNLKVTLTCDGETTPFGPEYAYCNTSGQWDPSPLMLTCYDKCAKPSLDDSNIIFTSDLNPEDSEQTYFDHADTVRFSCPGGIFVDGPWRASCNNGTWSARIGGYRPACRENCTGPVNTDVVDELFYHGQAHIFQCDGTPGMLRLGGPRAFCNDGAWKPNIRCAQKTEL